MTHTRKVRNRRWTPDVRAVTSVIAAADCVNVIADLVQQTNYVFACVAIDRSKHCDTSLTHSCASLHAHEICVHICFIHKPRELQLGVLHLTTFELN